MREPVAVEPGDRLAPAGRGLAGRRRARHATRRGSSPTTRGRGTDRVDRLVEGGRREDPPQDRVERHPGRAAVERAVARCRDAHAGAFSPNLEQPGSTNVANGGGCGDATSRTQVARAPGFQSQFWARRRGRPRPRPRRVHGGAAVGRHPEHHLGRRLSARTSSASTAALGVPRLGEQAHVVGVDRAGERAGPIDHLPPPHRWRGGRRLVQLERPVDPVARPLAVGTAALARTTRDGDDRPGHAGRLVDSAAAVQTIDRTRLSELMERERERFRERHPEPGALRAGRDSLLWGVPMNWMVRWPGTIPSTSPRRRARTSPTSTATRSWTSASGTPAGWRATPPRSRSTRSLARPRAGSR